MKATRTPEAERGRKFLEKLRLWKILHLDGGKTVFNKGMLARAFFGVEPQERHKRYVQRLISVLAAAGIVLDVDKDGNPLSQKQLKSISSKNKFAERWWKYAATETER